MVHVGGLEHFFFFHILGIIIPTDFHIFLKGRYTTNQWLFCVVFMCSWFRLRYPEASLGGRDRSDRSQNSVDLDHPMGASGRPRNRYSVWSSMERRCLLARMSSRSSFDGTDQIWTEIQEACFSTNSGSKRLDVKSDCRHTIDRRPSLGRNIQFPMPTFDVEASGLYLSLNAAIYGMRYGRYDGIWGKRIILNLLYSSSTCLVDSSILQGVCHD